MANLNKKELVIDLMECKKMVSFDTFSPIVEIRAMFSGKLLEDIQASGDEAILGRALIKAIEEYNG